MTNKITALQGALAFEILQRIVRAIHWDGSNGEATIEQIHLKLLNEATALCGQDQLYVNTKALGELEEIEGFPRDDWESKDVYAEHVDGKLAEQFEELRNKVKQDRDQADWTDNQVTPLTITEVYVNAEITVPRSRLSCEDMNVAGTYKMLVPAALSGEQQAAVAMALFHQKVGLKTPEHFHLQVIQVMPVVEPVDEKLAQLGTFKGVFNFHPRLEPTAR